MSKLNYERQRKHDAIVRNTKSRVPLRRYCVKCHRRFTPNPRLQWCRTCAREELGR